MNERVTETIVRTWMQELGFVGDGCVIEEQQSQREDIRQALRSAGKSGNGGIGSPEFIVTHPDTPDVILVVECKANAMHHVSPGYTQPVRNAVDGAIHYARALAHIPHARVIAIGVSGTNPDTVRSDTYTVMDSGEVIPWTDEHGNRLHGMFSWANYARCHPRAQASEAEAYAYIRVASRKIHDILWSVVKIAEEDKPLLSSGTLLALMNRSFRQGYQNYTAEDFGVAWLAAIRAVFRQRDIGGIDLDTVMQPYSAIAIHPNLGRPVGALADQYPRGVFSAIVELMDLEVMTYAEQYPHLDLNGIFYQEFLQYTAGDKRSLGIVLTPGHIASLFADIANVRPQTRVLDTCTGTGGFLINAAKRMRGFGERMATESLLGIEANPKMYALGLSNLMLNGVSDIRLWQGSCFDPHITAEISALSPQVALLNPPYAQDNGRNQLHELDFIRHALDMMESGGIAVAIVPVSCAIARNRAKQDIMAQHQLLAVMSMPVDVFYPVGTVTCIMVWRAHVPHTQGVEETWFARWMDDGMVRTRDRGRVDSHGCWDDIRAAWLDAYRNRRTGPDVGVLRRVSADDEWCAESYIPTSMADFTADNVVEMLKSYAGHVLLSPGSSHMSIDATPRLVGQNAVEWRNVHEGWSVFSVADICNMRRGEAKSRSELVLGNTPYVSASSMQNGITAYADIEPNTPGGVLTLTSNGSIGEAFYQPIPTFVNGDVTILRQDDFSAAVWMFVGAVLRLEKFRYNYGRKWGLDRLRATRIMLPVTADGAIDLVYINNIVASLPYSRLVVGE